MKLFHKNSTSDHLVRLKNLIKFKIQSSGVLGIDRQALELNLKSLLDGNGERFYNDQEIEESLNDLIGNGEVEHK